MELLFFVFVTVVPLIILWSVVDTMRRIIRDEKRIESSLLGFLSGLSIFVLIAVLSAVLILIGHYWVAYLNKAAMSGIPLIMGLCVATPIVIIAYAFMWAGINSVQSHEHT